MARSGKLELGGIKHTVEFVTSAVPAGADPAPLTLTIGGRIFASNEIVATAQAGAAMRLDGVQISYIGILQEGSFDFSPIDLYRNDIR